MASIGSVITRTILERLFSHVASVRRFLVPRVMAAT